MRRRKASGPRAKEFYTYRELPIGATSIGVHQDTIKTGIWRVQRPVFRQKAPPCSEACPAGVDVRAFISLMNQQRFKEAHRLYLEENPFPAICGRVCFHPCEAACNRKDFDTPVAINALERFLANFDAPILQKRSSDGGRVAVIGSGPAGLSCAYFLARLTHRVTVFEALGVIGGLLRTGIPDYRLPAAIVDSEVDKLKGMGIEFKTHHPIHKERWNDLEGFDAIVLAYGAGRNLRLPFAAPLSGRGVLTGLDFLRRANLNYAVSLGRKVAVIGGGNTAIDAARVALRLGASPTIIYRRRRTDMPAFQSEVEDALAEGIKILYLTSPVLLEENGDELRLKCVKNMVGEPGGDGRPMPKPIEGSEYFIDVDTVISAIGETPDLSILPPEIACSDGLVHADELGAVSVPGIFAVGDMIAQPRSVAHAIGSGKRTAIAIDCYLRGRPFEDVINALSITAQGGVSFQRYREGEPQEESHGAIDFHSLNPNHFQRRERAERPRISEGEALTSFREVYGDLPYEQALAEVQRCLSCGMCDHCDNCYLFCPDASVLRRDGELFNLIDYDYCKGCGICANECPVGVIDMEEEA